MIHIEITKIERGGRERKRIYTERAREWDDTARGSWGSMRP